MKIKLYNLAGKESGEVEAKDTVFAKEPKESVIHQVYEAILANAREPWAHTKGKGDVSGGGKKPWKQKGTGRARHGSIRSPIWRGGGITFGPKKERNYEQKINKKMNNLAVMMCLSLKAQGNQIVVLEDNPATGKTKEIAKLRLALPGANRSTLWVMDGKNVELLKTGRNIAKLDWQQAKDVNVVDLMRHQFIVTTKKGIEQLEKRLISKTK